MCAGAKITPWRLDALPGILGENCREHCRDRCGILMKHKTERQSEMNLQSSAQMVDVENDI